MVTERNSYFVGESLTYQLSLDPYNGLNMTDYDFVAEIFTVNSQYSQTPRITIQKSEMDLQEDGTYVMYIQTDIFSPGPLNVLVTAYIPNSKFPNNMEIKRVLFSPCDLKLPVNMIR